MEVSTMLKRLKFMPYATAYTYYTDKHNFALISYTTEVITVKDDILTVHGLYSMTTRRHISAFLREYTPFSFQLAKQLYTDKKSINITTGEIV